MIYHMLVGNACKFKDFQTRNTFYTVGTNFTSEQECYNEVRYYTFLLVDFKMESGIV